MKPRHSTFSQRQLIRTANLMQRWQKGGCKSQAQAQSRVAAFSKQACLDLTRRTEALLQARPGHSLWMTIPSDSTPPPSAAMGSGLITQPQINQKDTPAVQQCSSSSGKPAPFESVQDLLSYYKLNQTIPELNDDQLRQFIYELLEHPDIFASFKYSNHYQPSRFLGILLSRANNSQSFDHTEFDEKLIESLCTSDPDSLIYQHRRTHVLRAIRYHTGRFHVADFISRNSSELFFILPADLLMNLLYTNHKWLVAHRKYQGFLNTDKAISELQQLGLSKKSSRILTLMTEKKEFVSRKDHLRMLKLLLSSLNGYFSDDGTLVFKQYVNSIIEGLSSSRKDVKKFFKWLSSFVYAPQWVQIQIATEATCNSQQVKPYNINAEIKRIDQFYEDNLVKLLTDRDTPKGSLVVGNKIDKAVIHTIFTPHKQDQSAKEFVAVLKKSGFYAKILHAIRWLSEIGICELRHFIVKSYEAHKTQNHCKSLSLQEFPSDFINRWKQDYETPYNPKTQVSVEQFIKNAHQRLHDIIFRHDIPSNIFSRLSFIHYSGFFGKIRDIYRKLESGNIGRYDLLEMHETLQELNQELHLHQEYLYTETKPFSVLRAAEYLKRMEVFLDLHLNYRLSPRKFDDSVYKARVTGDAITMITTGEEPDNNCLSLWAYSGTNINGISFRRTGFVNYKTFVIEETKKDGSQQIACFADMEIRQYKGVTVLLVDKFYMRDGWMDEEDLKKQILKYAKDQLKLSEEHVFFPADQGKLPKSKDLDLTVSMLDPRVLVELKVYRDNFKI